MHGAPIRQIDVDAAGRFLVSGSDDKTVRVWSLEDGQLLKTLRVPLGEGNVGKVYAVAITPDGERIAAGGWGPGENGPNSIYVFERASGRIVARVDGLPNVINHLAFSPDGRHLVACLGGANGIRIYETEAFQEIASDRDYGGSTAIGRRSIARVGWSPAPMTARSGSMIRASASRSRKRHRAASGRSGSPSHPMARGSRSATTTARGSTCWMAKPSRHCSRPTRSGVGNGNLGKVAWSADGRYLYAGGRWQPARHALLRRWADGGRGAVRGHPAQPEQHHGPAAARGRPPRLRRRRSQPWRPRRGRQDRLAAGPRPGGFSRNQFDKSCRLP